MQVDLPVIKTKYEEMYKHPLKKDIERETSGDYRKALLKIVTVWGGKDTEDSEDTDMKSKAERAKSAKSERAKSAKSVRSVKKESAEDKTEEEPAVKLHKAMDGVGADVHSVTEIITKCSNAERQDLKKRYQELYKKVYCGFISIFIMHFYLGALSDN